MVKPVAHSGIVHLSYVSSGCAICPRAETPCCLVILSRAGPVRGLLITEGGSEGAVNQEVEPHIYVPNVEGDCSICGNTQDHPLHIKPENRTRKVELWRGYPTEDHD